MMQGLPPRAGSERSMDQMCESMDKNRILGPASDERATYREVPHPSRARSVDPAGCEQKTAELTPGDLLRVASATELSKGGLTAGQKSAEGILGHDVGKGSEHSESRKAEQMDRLSRERWPKAEREGEAQ